MSVERKAMISAILLIGVMLAGEALIYVANPYHYDSSVSGNEYSVYASVSGDYEIIQYTSAQPDIDGIYVYFDSDYKSSKISSKDATYFVNELKIRSKSSEIVNAHQILDVISSSDPSTTALVFLDGVLPDTIYAGSSGDPIFNWLDNGGRIYWMGGSIGKQISTPGEIQDAPAGWESLFFDSGMVNQEESRCSAEIPDSGIGRELCLRNTNCQFGLSSSCPNSLSLGYVSDGGYCSASVAKCRSGQVCIVGAYCTDEARGDLAQILASGISYDSVMIFNEEKHCNNSTETGSLLDVPGSKIYVYCGGHFTCYGKMHVL